ncbi:MAG: response regulator [Endomicrobiaceae bacterium]|nr:response regulator [Endomicrobiaceae bacterium]
MDNEKTNENIAEKETVAENTAAAETPVAEAATESATESAAEPAVETATGTATGAATGTATESATGTATESAAASDKANTNKKEVPRVLIVEDDDTARLSLKVALEAENIFVEAVENGSNAENMIKYSTFDVVIVDYRLPDIDGLNLIKKMKVLVPDLMTLVVTAHTSVEIAVDAMKMGAYDYMAKPLDIPNLVNVIYKILKEKNNLYDSRQKVVELVTKRPVEYMFHDDQVSIITAPDPNILVEGNNKGGFFKSVKKFFIGVKNYYWGA